MARGVLAALVVFHRHQLVAGHIQAYVRQRQRARNVGHEAERCVAVGGSQLGVGDGADGFRSLRIARVRLVQQDATGLCVRLHRTVLDDDRVGSLHRGHRAFLGESRDAVHRDCPRRIKHRRLAAFGCDGAAMDSHRAVATICCYRRTGLTPRGDVNVRSIDDAASRTMQAARHALRIVDGDAANVDGSPVGGKHGIGSLGIGGHRAARHIDSRPAARCIDSRVGAVETGVIARIAAAVVACLRDAAVCQRECAIGNLHHVVVGRGGSECLTVLLYC